MLGGIGPFAFLTLNGSRKRFSSLAMHNIRFTRIVLQCYSGNESPRESSQNIILRCKCLVCSPQRSADAVHGCCPGTPRVPDTT